MNLKKWEEIMVATRFLTAMAVAGVVLVPVSALAGKMTGSGHNANHNVSTETKKLPDGRLLMRMHDANVIMGNNPGNPFHMTSLDCYSTFIATADGASGKGGGYCQGLDKDGDLWWIHFQGDFTGGTWTLMGGTGKFDGIKGGGTYKPVAQLEGGRSMTVWDGTWEMK
jgi:hypothetical protein